VADRARQLGVAAGLYPFQLDGAAFLAERDYALLADQMGIGKTCQALAAAEARLSFGAVPTPTTPAVLILCPALAKRHWQREIRRWTGHEAVVLDGLRPDQDELTARYIIANYDILKGARRRDAAGVMHEAPDLPGWGSTLAGRFLIVIGDEAHMLRGRSSQRSTAIRAVCRGAVVVWLLTGTPVPNHIRDLWAQIDLMSGGLHGKYWDWAKVYCAAKQGKYGWDDTGSDRLDELSARLSFFMLGRSKETVGLQLPEKRREVFRVDVETTAPTVHDAAEALAKQRAVSRALRVTARAKRSAVVAQAVEALQAKQKVIVFTYHRDQADAIAKAIKDDAECPVACVHGDLSPDGRDAQAQVFREIPAPAAFVATIDSIGLAISLVGADLVIFGDLVWEPHKLLQAEARAHRHGSTNRVLVRYMVATGTIDEVIAERVVEKLATIEAALGKEVDQHAFGELLTGRSDEMIIDALFDRLKRLSAEKSETAANSSAESEG
jgi:SWI/SNF-related matrix-associated actin-dependent regulator 1 of chromatin subfamily A